MNFVLKTFVFFLIHLHYEFNEIVLCMYGICGYSNKISMHKNVTKSTYCKVYVGKLFLKFVRYKIYFFYSKIRGIINIIARLNIDLRKYFLHTIFFLSTSLSSDLIVLDKIRGSAVQQPTRTAQTCCYVSWLPMGGFENNDQ